MSKGLCLILWLRDKQTNILPHTVAWLPVPDSDCLVIRWTKDPRIFLQNTCTHKNNILLVYCKKLIFRLTLFSRAHDFGFIHETLFSRFFISCIIILTWVILAWTLFSRVIGLANLRENKVLANKKCFTVLSVQSTTCQSEGLILIFYNLQLQYLQIDLIE